MFVRLRTSGPRGPGLLLSALCLGHCGAQAREPAKEANGEPEVVVSGDRPHPTRTEEPSVAAFTIPRGSLETPGRQLGDALREAPGVQVTQMGGLGSPTTARLRGATSAQTPVYFGSVKLNDEVGGVADLGLIPNAFVESVQIYRSNAPRTSAELGIGGAIFIAPRKSPLNAALVRLDLGSFGAKALSFARGFSSDKRDTNVFVNLDGAQNDYSFHDSRGTLFVPDDDRTTTLTNADSRGLGAWIQHREKFKDAEVEVFLGHTTREQGALKLALVPTQEARAAHERTIAQVTSKLRRGGTKLELLSAATSSQTTIRDPLLELSPFSAHLETPGERFEQAAIAEHELTRHIAIYERLSGSIERFRRYEQRGGEFTESLAAERFVARLAAGVDYRPTRAITWSTLGEFRCVSTTPLSACAEPVPAGRTSLTVKLGPFESYAAIGRAVRVPTLSELYGFSPVSRGNPRLLPEEATTAEIGARYATKAQGKQPLLWLDLSAFARSSKDLVLFVRTAQGYLTPQNRSSARTLGAELALGVNPGPFSFAAQTSLLDPRDTSPDRTTKNDFLPFLSALTASVSAHARILEAPQNPFAWGLGLRAFYQSSRYADPAGLGEIPEQTNVDLETEASLPHKELTLRASLRNLFDTPRFDVVGFPLPGRSFFVSLEAQFR